MGKVSELLIEILKRNLNERGIVVWYDPQKAYSNMIRNLSLPDTNILIYKDGFFRLRAKLEPFLEFVTEEGNIKENADLPPSILVYIPMAREECGFALIEAETAGTVMEPNATNKELDTRLGFIVQKVFGEIAPARAAHLARQADEGLISIEELDRMAEDVGSKTIGALQGVFGGVPSEEMILQFLASNTKDAVIEEKNLVSELESFFNEELGFEKTGFRSASDLRTMLRRYVLSVDLLTNIPSEEIPGGLRRLPIPDNNIQKDLIRHLCSVWRNRLDLKDFYIEAAEMVEKALGFDGVEFPLNHLKKVETFPFVERCFLNYAIAKLLESKAAEALKVENERDSLFWAREHPSYQMEWKIVDAAANLILESARVKQELKRRKWTFDEMIEAYATHAEPWLRLDRYARILSSRYVRLESFDSGSESLEKAVIMARQKYADTINLLSLSYAKAAYDLEFRSRRYKSQTEIFVKSVKPFLDQKIKTAYFLIDALRYEMACELMGGLGKDYESWIEPILGQLPGITTVGMASLLPGAEGGIFLDKKGEGFSVSILGQSLPNRQARMTWIKEKSGVQAVAFKLGEVVKLTPKRKKEIEEAQLVVVTSQEIDRLAEETSEDEEMRVYIEDVLEKVRRAIRTLSRAGVQQFVISADHGFHMVDSFDPGFSVDPPGGETVELHPRVWIGNGGVAAEGYLRLKASDLELGGSLEFAFPLGLGVFRIKGGVGPYFHGGISPQEHILPLLLVKAPKFAGKVKSDIRVKMTLPKPKITNRIFTVKVEAEREGLFMGAERRFQIEILSGKKVIGQAVASGYGYEESTHEIIVKPGEPNVITLMIDAGEKPDLITIQLIDSENQLVIESLKDIPVEFAI